MGRHTNALPNRRDEQQAYVDYRLGPKGRGERLDTLTRDPEVCNRRLTDPVTQSVKSRAVESGPTLAIITEDVLSKEVLALAVEMNPQALDLLVNGLGQHLPVGRYADIDSVGHRAPPRMAGALWSTRAG